MYRVIGTCSQCGGKVVIPDVWGGIIPPTPTCQHCHATLEQPVITTTQPNHLNAIYSRSKS